ncbi:MAG: hypothetical protein KatS3mg050_0101 [Litorilinea sp.]|nr:MAG: hypothetical protein KatS3mg050_0101 [Litorilinea sp.]
MEREAQAALDAAASLPQAERHRLLAAWQENLLAFRTRFDPTQETAAPLAQAVNDLMATVDGILAPAAVAALPPTATPGPTPTEPFTGLPGMAPGQQESPGSTPAALRPTPTATSLLPADAPSLVGPTQPVSTLRPTQRGATATPTPGIAQAMPPPPTATPRPPSAVEPDAASDTPPSLPEPTASHTPTWTPRPAQGEPASPPASPTTPTRGPVETAESVAEQATAAPAAPGGSAPLTAPTVQGEGTPEAHPDTEDLEDDTVVEQMPVVATDTPITSAPPIALPGVPEVVLTLVTPEVPALPTLTPTATLTPTVTGTATATATETATETATVPATATATATATPMPPTATATADGHSDGDGHANLDTHGHGDARTGNADTPGHRHWLASSATTRRTHS